MRTDNGGEFTSKEFEEFCAQEGITRHFSISGTLQQNRIAKWMNTMLLKRAQCIRLFANLFKQFWVKIMSTTCYLVNQSPSTSLKLKTP